MSRTRQPLRAQGERGLTLDAGALIAVERRQRTVTLILDEARREGATICIPAGVLGQVWRSGARQARLASLLAAPTVIVVPLDEATAKASGELCGARGTDDVVDASVVLCARRYGHPVVTGDPDDLHRLDPALRLVSLN